MSRELVIYADESIDRGPIYSNFYGGALVESVDLAEVRERLQDAKDEAGFLHEVKWQRVSGQYLDPYLDFVDAIFDMLDDGLMKMRVMFTQNRFVPVGLERYHYEHQYHILYYEFIKHAFGLRFANDGTEQLAVRLYVDALPDNRAKNAVFKSFITSLGQDQHLRRAGIVFPYDQIAEVVSSEHIILQAVDVVLGSMQFRLNKRHLDKPAGAWRRGNRTIAKEKVYHRINERIRAIYPGFNIGASTGHESDTANRWNHAYRHWLFKPREMA